MKHIVVASTQPEVLNFYCSFLLKHIRKTPLRYERNQNETVITDHVVYHFVNLNYRNLDRFAKKYGKVERVYQDEGLLGDNTVHEKLVGLVEDTEQDLHFFSRKTMQDRRDFLLKGLLDTHPLLAGKGVLRYRHSIRGSVIEVLVTDSEKDYGGLFETKEAARADYAQKMEERVRHHLEAAASIRRELDDYRAAHGIS